MSDGMLLQAEALSLLARDLTLFPDDAAGVLASYKIDPAMLPQLEANPVFQASAQHAMQQLLDDPLYSRRLLMAAKVTVLAEKLLGEAVSGLMEHGNSIKVLEFSARIANMEPPKVTKASNDNKNTQQASILDPQMFKQASKDLSTDELQALEAIIAKMGSGSL